MSNQLPRDLREAERFMLDSLLMNLNTNSDKRLSLDLRFEGLRLMPVVIRLCQSLSDNNIKTLLCWPDAGATALAKNKYSDFANIIFSFKELKGKSINEYQNKLLICVSPQPYDYVEFSALVEGSENRIVMLNGKLEDGAVGIGSVGRERRKGFVSSWNNIFWVQPLSNGALMKCYPNDWSVFRLDPDGYRYIRDFKNKPSPETLAETIV